MSITRTESIPVKPLRPRFKIRFNAALLQGVVITGYFEFGSWVVANCNGW